MSVDKTKEIVTIDKSVNKVDNEEKITGKAVYIDDIKPEGTLYARTYRSPVSKGVIISRSYPDLPEGYTIVDCQDITGENYVNMIYEDWPIFADETVHHIGEPILLIVGQDKVVIEDIMSAIEIEIEEEEPVYDYIDSAVHYDYDKGDGEACFDKAHQTITYTYNTGYQEQLYIEPQGVIGLYEHGRITVMGSIQCPYYVKNALLVGLGCGEDDVRVVQTTTGGAFGGKEEFPSLIACQVAIAVQKIQKPIKLIYGRSEDVAFTTKRHPSTIHMEAAIDEERRLIGIRSHVSLNGGAFIGLSGVVLQRAMIAATGAYTIDHLSISGDVYRTNTVPTGAFRGFGAPQMIFAVEMFMQHIAKELRLDPLVFKQFYLAKQGDKTSTSGEFRDPIIMTQMIERVMELSDYKDKVKRYDRSTVHKGIGMSWFLHGCGFTGSGEQDHIKAVVRLQKSEEDVVTILVASVDMGQGVKTTFRKLVASLLELPMDQVVFNNPDTDLVPDSGPTVASRTMMVVGGLLARAAKLMKEEWLSGEAKLVEERYKQPDYVKWDQDSLQGDAYPAYSWGCNVVEVDVDTVTSEVSIVGTWSVYDVGKAIDEKVIYGQADGGLLQGISYGYLEVMNNYKGIVHQRSVTDYVIPTAVDTTYMVTELMDNPYPLGPYGAKGAGELTLIGGAPAVALAIENAIGKKVMQIPASPEYIVSLKREASK